MPVKSINKLLSTSAEILADSRQVKVVCSTSGVDRMGDIIVQEGIDLTAYKKNPVVLWGHDSDVPVASAIEIGVEGGKLKALVQFPPEGEDEDADWVYGKIKSGIVNATSVGFNPIKYEAIDPREPWGGLKFLESELLEFSFVSVPANKDCLIVGRSIYAVEQQAKPDAPVISPETALARVMELPKVLRATAKGIKNKGARGHYLHHANMIEEAVTGVKKNAKGDAAPVAEEAIEAEPDAEVETEAAPEVDTAGTQESLAEGAAPDEQAATGFTDIAARRLVTLRHKLTD